LEHIFRSFPEDFRLINEYEAKTMLTKLGIIEYDRTIGTLSGGQRKIVSLVAALIHPADILILDEPTNHLDSEMVAWLEEWLRSFRGGLIMVTHDRYFLERVCNHITELSRGKLYHYEANYSKYLELKAQRAEMAEASERKRQSILRVEREWIMRGCKARTTKSKERIQRYEELLNRDAPETDDTIKITAATSRLGRKIIELDHIGKKYDDRTIISDFSYNLLRTDRIGIVGRNGAGKSTLLHMIAGLLSPDSGTVDMGSTVKIGLFSQHGRELDLNQRVYDFIHEIASEVRSSEGVLTAKQMMERFMFPSELHRQPIGKLSGGERRRLYLLSVLMAAPNVLLLDEPTNDLDVMTLSILEDYLDDFQGPIIMVSHDRFFLDKLAENIFEVRGNGEVVQYTGNWTDWASKRESELTPVKQEKPKPVQNRPKEKKLKFTFKEEREFQTIDDDIAQLEDAIAENAKQQSIHCTDYVKLQELHDEQAELEAKLEEKTERWFYLNDLKERIDAQK
ncbi:MAG: ABC-F family ATP-binding cassette domain-containing protein, partial [Oscillospiraceae bacterium]|nr:ABC-F family ATP-binding cassette domain-containing protein [Oscillospiraceae bacterium]